MVLDDSKWFASAKRIREEWAPVTDEMLRVHTQGAVRSDFEYIVHSEIVEWMEQRKEQVLGMDMRDVIKLFWNERLN